MNEELVFPVYCPECGWFGMSDDVRYMTCPSCGERVVKDESQMS
jgi:predicted Zn-ribbon and HTH transcriptional regulator